MAEEKYIYAEDKRKVVFTDLEKDLFNKYIVEQVKEELNNKGREYTVENARRIDWYEMLKKVLPGIIFCVVKKKNEDEMSLFAMDNPELQTFGFKYAGEENIDKFWESLDSAITFDSKDFFVRVYKESTTKKGKISNAPVRFEKDEDGAVITVLRNGKKGKSCLLVEENYDTYDRIVDPDSILGDCIRTKMVGNLREWAIKMIEKFDFIEK